MKKILLIVGLMMLLLLVGCKKHQVKDTSSLEDTSDKVVETSTKEPTEKPAEKAEKEVIKEEETVAEDIYEEGHEAVDIRDLDVKEVEAIPVNDPELKKKMTVFLEPFFYNLYFGWDDYSENGITESDMVKFAISYIYQNEYNELKFDTETFILYVPDERVDELVLKYFDHKVVDHHDFEEEGIVYKEGDYLMPAVDTGWSSEMFVTSITKAGDFAYNVIFEIHDIDGNLENTYAVLLEKRTDRFIVSEYGYKKENLSEETVVDDTTQSEDSTKTEE